MPFVCGVAWQSPNKRDCIKMSKIKSAASFQLLLLRCLLLFCRGRLFTRNACVVSACVRGLWHMRNSLSRVAIPSSVCPQRESQRLVRQPWRDARSFYLAIHLARVGTHTGALYSSLYRYHSSLYRLRGAAISRTLWALHYLAALIAF